MSPLTQKLLDQKAALEAERDAIDTKTAPMRKELEALQADEEKVRVKIMELHRKIKAIEHPRREEISRDLVVIAKATSKAVPEKTDA